MKNYEEFTPAYFFIPKEEGDESGVFGIGLGPAPVEPKEDGSKSKGEEPFAELIKSCLKKAAFWKKEEAVDKPDPQEGDQKVQVIYVNMNGSASLHIPAETVETPPTPVELLGMTATGTGKTKYRHPLLVDSTPPMSDEERAELEAKKREKATQHEESAKLSGIPITEEEAEAYTLRDVGILTLCEALTTEAARIKNTMFPSGYTATQVNVSVRRASLGRLKHSTPTCSAKSLLMTKTAIGAGMIPASISRVPLAHVLR